MIIRVRSLSMMRSARMFLQGHGCTQPAGCQNTAPQIQLLEGIWNVGGANRQASADLAAIRGTLRANLKAGETSKCNHHRW